MLLRDLQRLLLGLYGIEIEADVSDYLVTDAAALARWEDPEAARDTEEKLLIEECGDEIAMALYLDAAVLKRLSDLDPRQQLSGRNLADFWLALEGVSHFNYVAWNASMDKPVTLLELEMQAEIDKYVGARALLGRQRGSDLAGALLGSLFDQPAFDTGMPPAELRRYRDANRLAGGYCRSLQSRFPRGVADNAMVRELRAFFRWTQPAKVSHIRSAVLSA